SDPTSVPPADLNGDGRADLVVPNAGSDNVSILLGNSSGGLTPAVGSPVASDGTPGPAEPVAAAVAPLNHDSIPDIALVNKGSDDVSILLGNGTGRFGSPVSSPVPTLGDEPVAITSGDFDWDGDIDLAVANEGTNTVSILRNDGSGGFTASIISLGSGSANAPRVITSGYFDGDASLDLAVGLAGGGVAILLNNGSGGFPPAAGSPVSTLATQPVSLVSADLNGDSIPDLALIGAGESLIRLLVGNGAGGFTETSNPPFPGGGP